MTTRKTKADRIGIETQKARWMQRGVHSVCSTISWLGLQIVKLYYEFIAGTSSIELLVSNYKISKYPLGILTDLLQ